MQNITSTCCIAKFGGSKSSLLKLEEFYRRAGERKGVEAQAAETHVHGVMSVLKDAITRGELTDVEAQLPKDFQPLFR
jgi:uncharacterized protein (DUF2267 family)